jgi:tetratricopeptide (TPR) repeat protein
MVVERQSNPWLRDVIAATGWTYEALARAVRRVAAENGEDLRTNKSAVAHWVNGVRPSGWSGRYLAEALSRRAGRVVSMAEIGLELGGPVAVVEDLVAAVVELGRADVDRRRFLVAAVFTVAGVGMPLVYDHEPVSRMLRARAGLGFVGDKDIAVVRDITLAFSAADEQLGGGHGLTTVAAYLADTAAPMLRARFSSDGLRRRAFGAVAELAYLAGWKHHDLGQEGAAQRYYLVGYQLACEADPHGLAAWMMRALAHQALDLKQPRHCADLTARALERGVGHVDGQSEAVLHIIHARACALIGERAAAAQAILAAENAFTRHNEPRPLFSAVAGPVVASTIAFHTAAVLTDLADHGGAERQHRAALLAWDPEKNKRVCGLTQANLGDSLAAQGRAEEAMGAWAQALDLADGVASDRTRKAIVSMRLTLAGYRKRGVPGAVDLDRRVYGNQSDPPLTCGVSVLASGV